MEMEAGIGTVVGGPQLERVVEVLLSLVSSMRVRELGEVVGVGSRQFHDSLVHEVRRLHGEQKYPFLCAGG